MRAEHSLLRLLIVSLLPVSLVAGCRLNWEWFGGARGESGERSWYDRPVYTATVQAFHRLSPGDRVRYAFLPIRLQAGDIEYDTYREMARFAFSSRGWAEVGRDEADVLVVMDYGIDDGKPYTIEIPVFGQTGVTSATTSGNRQPYGGFTSTTTFSPSFGIVGYTKREVDQYVRGLYILAFDARGLVEGVPRAVFQGRAVSVGSTPHLSPVMPFLTRLVIGQVADESGAIRERSSDLW